MKKSILLSVSLFFIMCCLPPAEAVDLYKTEYKCFDTKGNERWSATTEVMLTVDGISFDIFEIIEKASGTYGGFDERISWETILELKEEKDDVKPVKMEKRIFDKNGKLIIRDLQEFDFSKNTVTLKRENLVTGKKEEKAFVFEGDIVNRPFLATYIQKMLGKGETQKSVYMITDKPRLYRMNIRVEGEKKIEIDARSVTAHKIQIEPDLGIFNVFKFILPKMYMWHMGKPRFEWLKYAGPESTIKSPEVVMIRGK